MQVDTNRSFQNTSNVVSDNKDKVDQKPPTFVHETALGVYESVKSAAGFYAFFRTLSHFKFISPENVPAFKPMLVFGLTATAVVQSIRLTHTIGLKIIGDRANVEPSSENTLKKTGAVYHFRSFCWTGIRGFERVARAVDSVYTYVFSFVFKVRPLEQLNAKKIIDLDMTFIEIVRKAILDQITDSSIQHIQKIAGYAALSALKLSIPGLNVLDSMEKAFIILTFSTRILDVYNRWFEREDQREAEATRKLKEMDEECREGFAMRQAEIEDLLVKQNSAPIKDIVVENLLLQESAGLQAILGN
ncbi:MAG: hypothetical protein H0W88_03215 [Parachlamydiaceae bacterium]|nr:hypothetical protein [Parachlamydiaceae bacterium]